jgi:hypothetical protein
VSEWFCAGDSVWGSQRLTPRNRRQAGPVPLRDWPCERGREAAVRAPGPRSACQESSVCTQVRKAVCSLLTPATRSAPPPSPTTASAHSCKWTSSALGQRRLGRRRWTQRCTGPTVRLLCLFSSFLCFIDDADTRCYAVAESRSRMAAARAVNYKGAGDVTNRM